MYNGITIICQKVEVLLLRKVRNELWDWLRTIVIAVILVFIVQHFLFTPMEVDGASMMPTYEDGDHVIVNKITKTFSEFDRFDVVVFEAYENTYYIKRVIGMPGDTVEYRNDMLYINGEVYEEPYLSQYKLDFGDYGNLTYNFTLQNLMDVSQVPEGYYFVLGDNRRKSSDSRDPSVGFVSKNQILGKANIRIYPFSHLGFVE